MVIKPKQTHPDGEDASSPRNTLPSNTAVDTYDGKIHIEWDSDASVTPIGQLPYFIQFLKLGGRFDSWVNDSPLFYRSNNAPKKTDVLGSLFLSILSGHKRYAHLTSLISDNVNPSLLGMSKVVSEDSARRGMKKIDEERGVQWLQNHLFYCYEPLLNTSWILDVDTTVKPLYGRQEAAEIGYNPQKPGRPSQTYHTYMMANLRMILDVEVKPGNQAHSSHSLPGLIELLNRLPKGGKPEFVRGDIAWGTDIVMDQLEELGQPYLFKLKKSKNVMNLIYKHHGIGKWTSVASGWEAKEDTVKLHGWKKERRVIIVRRQLSNQNIIGVESSNQSYQQLSFIDGPENTKAFEYSVLITDRSDDLTSIFFHYRDRADCENNFDELKNQWGWGGYTTKDVKSCRFMSRIIALIYNWWTLYTRLAFPDQHHEAITSKPLLLTSVGRMTTHGGQKKVTLTSSHGKIKKIAQAYARLTDIFNSLKQNAPQLSCKECWNLMLARIIEYFSCKNDASPPINMGLSTT